MSSEPKEIVFHRTINGILFEAYTHFELGNRLSGLYSEDNLFWRESIYAHYLLAINNLIIILEYRRSPDTNSITIQNYICYLRHNIDQLVQTSKDEALIYLDEVSKSISSSMFIKRLMDIRDKELFHRDFSKADLNSIKILKNDRIRQLFNYIYTTMEGLSLYFYSRGSAYNKIDIFNPHIDKIMNSLECQ